MASGKAWVTSVAERYAKALFELAYEYQILDQVEVDLIHLRALLSINTDFRRFVASPVLSRNDHISGIAAVSRAVDVSSLTKHFIMIVAVNRRLSVLPAMITAFLSKLAKSRNECLSEVIAAQPLSSDQQAALEAALTAATGKEVHIEVRVDPSLLGGLVIKVGSLVVDSSLSTKLQRLELAMKGIG